MDKLKEYKFYNDNTIHVFTKEDMIEFGNFMWMKASIHGIECEPLVITYFNEWLKENEKDENK